MSVITQLVGFGLRQVIGDAADNAVQVIEVIEQRFRDHSRTLPKALDQAHNRAWQALGVALAGDGFLDRVKVFFASGDDKGVREQVQVFLKSNAVSFDGTPDAFRQACLDELKRLRKSGLLSASGGSAAEIARQAAGFKRHADPQGLIEESRRAVAGVADALAGAYPNLSRLLRTPTPAGPPLLAAAFCYFFRREVETDDELAHGLFFDGLRQLSASQAKAFGEVGKALAALGGQFDALFEQLGRIEAAVAETQAVAAETHGAVLDLQAEMDGMHGENREFHAQVLLHLGLVGMQRGEVRPGDSCSIRGEDERRAVKALLAQFRQLPAEEQRKMPALLNGLGKLQHGAGDHAEACQTFTEVGQVVGDPSAKAEAAYNAYRAALEEKKWDAALAALREAASHDPLRFAPFPLHDYEPQRILGAGGFGTVFYCRDLVRNQDVAVKALHTADLNRSIKDVFREAEILARLQHPNLIGVKYWGYADADRTRPYIVMDYFPGITLQQFVEYRGLLNVGQLLAVAVPVAEAMRAAHAQGVLHRDLKPANVLVGQEGDAWTVKIIDFGLALRQQTIETSRVRIGATQKSMLDWSVAGTLDYAPPEQLGKQPGVQPGPYSDVYAFAKTCCYAMFKTTELRLTQWQSLPPRLAKLLEECLDPDTRQRPQGFGPVLEGLGECSRGGREAQSREEAERLRREQEEEQRRQMEGEEQLRQLVRAALDRTDGKPTSDDTAAAKGLCRRHKLTADRANAVVREVRELWRQERDEREREKERQEAEDEAFRIADAELWQQERDEQEREKKRQEAEDEAFRIADAARRQRQDEERQREEAAPPPPPRDSGSINLLCPNCQKPLSAPVQYAGQLIRCPLCAGTFTVPPLPKMSAPPPPVSKAGELYTNSLGMKFAWIPPGTFLMGSPPNELERQDDETQHKVTLTKGFWMGVHQVTQAQWQAVMGFNPSNCEGANRPVEEISWNDAFAFCTALRTMDGKMYRLPTEAEWEYACRAGTTTPFHFGATISTDQANYDGRYTYDTGKEGVYRKGTTPVGSFPANAWGLFDMHGNVWEWCQDLYAPYKTGDITDSLNETSGGACVLRRVLRGGSYFRQPWDCRSAFRFRRTPGSGNYPAGCRVCLCLD